MEHQTVTLGGQDYVIVPREEFDRMASSKASGIPLPEYPDADECGNRPAVAFARASIARSIITRMNALGLSQAELSRLAGVPRPTLNRILKCTRTPDASTAEKLEKALGKQEKSRR